MYRRTSKIMDNIGFNKLEINLVDLESRQNGIAADTALTAVTRNFFLVNFQYNLSDKIM